MRAARRCNRRYVLRGFLRAGGGGSCFNSASIRGWSSSTFSRRRFLRGGIMPSMRTPHVSRRHFLHGIGGVAALAATRQAVPSAAQASPPARTGSLTDVGGLRVGHFTDPRRPTGCTAILFDKPATAGVDYDGSAPGESLGVVLQPVSPLDQIHGIFLTGGGPMALGATSGVVRFLEERQVGYDWGVPNVRVPIVVGAVIDDLCNRRWPHSRRARRGVSGVPGGVSRPGGGRQRRRGHGRHRRQDVRGPRHGWHERRRRHRLGTAGRCRDRGDGRPQRRRRHRGLAPGSDCRRSADGGWPRLRALRGRPAS